MVQVPLFARVEEGFIHALTQKMEPVSTSVGETLVKQGEVRGMADTRLPSPAAAIMAFGLAPAQNLPTPKMAFAGGLMQKFVSFDTTTKEEAKNPDLDC